MKIFLAGARGVIGIRLLPKATCGIEVVSGRQTASHYIPLSDC